MGQPAAIFDLDGTLVDSLDDLTGSVNHALRRCGLPEQDRIAIAGMIGDGARKLIERAVGSADADTTPDVFAAFVDHYEDHCLERSHVYEGIAAVLDRLTDAGWRLGVLSNKPDRFTRSCCDALLADWPFNAIAGQREGVPKKPDPTAARAMLDAWGVAPEDGVFIGDSPGDVRTGRAAGMGTIAVAWGYRAVDVLAAAEPDRLVRTPEELTAALLD